VVHQPLLKVGFCAGDGAAAELFRAAIAEEHVGARVGRFHPDGGDQPEACDVELPCRPDATERDVDQAVLAVIKATHAPACPVPGMLPHPPGL
jgi:hypothetical protein